MRSGVTCTAAGSPDLADFRGPLWNVKEKLKKDATENTLLKCGFVCGEVQQTLLIPPLSCVYVCCMLTNVEDGSSAQLSSIKDTCVYLWGWGPCPPRRKVHSSELFPAVWCQNCTHHPSGFLEEGGGRILAAQGPSKASLNKEWSMRWARKWPRIQKNDGGKCILA